MFTGIVDHIGHVERVTSTATSKIISIKTNYNDLKEGESVSVNGVCLTITDLNKNVFSVDVSFETLKCTNFSELKIGMPLNLERAMTLADRFGGHYVTGHVDSTLSVERVKSEGEYLEVTFGPVMEQFRKYIHSKGSITLNGVSLTVNVVKPLEASFNTMLIPHTLERTNLKFIHPGMRLNVEFDWMAKIIVKRLEERLESYLPVVEGDLLLGGLVSESNALSRSLEPTFHKDKLLEDI